jgi:hypothetical protein
MAVLYGDNWIMLHEAERECVKKNEFTVPDVKT